MKLFSSKTDRDMLLLRYLVYREDELVLASAMLEDAKAIVDSYMQNIEHAGVKLSVRDYYTRGVPVVYWKRAEPRSPNVVVSFTRK